MQDKICTEHLGELRDVKSSNSLANTMDMLAQPRYPKSVDLLQVAPAESSLWLAPTGFPNGTDEKHFRNEIILTNKISAVFSTLTVHMWVAAFFCEKTTHGCCKDFFVNATRGHQI